MEQLQTSNTKEEITKLIGEITDFKTELTEENVNVEDLDIKEGDFNEKYFNEN